MKVNNKALKHHIKLLKEGKLVYKNGEIWKYWHNRWGWRKIPKRAEKLNSSGYYCLRENNKYVMAHRVIWVYFKGNIPKGLEVNHKNFIKTDNRIKNLELKTSKGNKEHAIKNGRYKWSGGNKHCRLKIKDEDIPKIFHLRKKGTNPIEIANKYHVNLRYMYRILKRERRNKLCKTCGLYKFNCKCT